MKLKEVAIRTKITLTFLSLIIGAIIITGVIFYSNSKQSIVQSGQNMMENTNHHIEDLVATIAQSSIQNYLRGIAEKNIDIIKYYYTSYQQGRITKQEAFETIRKSILSQRIGSTGYIYVWDISNAPTSIPVVIHPFIQGREVQEYDFVQKAAQIKNGYLEYNWKNPDETNMRAKSMYLSYFPEWNWVVAVSSYKEEFLQLIDLPYLNKRIKSIKIGKSDYPVILDYKGNVISHPYLEGKNIYNLSDKNGKYFIREVCQNKNGNMEYYWKKPNSDDKDYKKIVFYKDNPLFKWIIVTGLYEDELYAELETLDDFILLAIILISIITIPVVFFVTGKLIIPIKNMADELYHLKSYLANIINSMPSILISVDKNGTVTQWNKQAEDVTGISVENATGRSVTEVYPRLTEYLDKIDESIRERKIVAEKNRAHQTGKGVRYEDITVYPLVTNGATGAVIRIDDVTREYTLEEQLNQSRKMDAVGQLAGGVAHDFNNMLAGIMGAAEILNIINANDEKSLKYTEIIIKSSQRAAGLISKLLDFSRKSNIEKKSLNVHKTINDTVEILERSIDKRIKIITDIKATYYNIMGDESQLHNAILNMGINSAHAMPNGGQLTFSTENVFLDKKYCDHSSFNIIPGNYIVIEVRDTGTGIPSDIMHKIFEPFFTTKKQGEGTGLGLAAVYGIVKEHFGALSVYSEVDRGTVFHLYLPLSNESNIHLEEKPLEHGQGLILLTDDEEIIRLTSQEILESLGYRVITAENGVQAVEQFTANKDSIDLVILDMMMPEMNGREAFHEIKKIRPDAKIIISSGFSKNEELNELYAHGLNDFVKKPFRIEELSAVVKKWI